MNEMYIYVCLYLSFYFVCQCVRYQCISLYGFILKNCYIYITYIIKYFYISIIKMCGACSSFGIATDYGLDGPGSNPGGDDIFRPSRPTLRPTQPPVIWVPALSQG